VPLYGHEEKRGMHLIVPSQLSYLCQTGVWGAYVISQWVHICFLSYWIGSDTILVPRYGREETGGTRFAVPSQFPYHCQKGVWGAYVISQWVHICFLSYCIGYNTVLVPLYGLEEMRGTRLAVLSQSPYHCQKGVWGAYVISQWVHIRFLSYWIGFNTILVSHCGRE
jgi:nicotinamidase-related amidase